MTQTSKQAALALIDPNSEAIQALDRIAADCGIALYDNGRKLSLAIRQANAIAQLKAMLTPDIMAGIMSLQGTGVGFRTDKDKDGGYPVEVVKDCLIEATMRGLTAVGNQFNIIANRCYITKEGYAVLLKNIEGLRYMLTPGVPKMSAQGAEVPVKIEWKYNGEKNSEDLTFAVRLNAGMGADGAIGKATKKAEKWLFTYITGMEWGDADLDEIQQSQTKKPSRFAPIDITPKEARDEATDEAMAQLCADCGLSEDQIREMYVAMKWAMDDNWATARQKVCKVPAAKMTEAWGMYQQRKETEK